jgi:hypothetical protein
VAGVGNNEIRDLCGGWDLDHPQTGDNTKSSLFLLSVFLWWDRWDFPSRQMKVSPGATFFLAYAYNLQDVQAVL